MALRKLSELLENAENGGYAVGYFEAWDTYSLEAVAEAAVEESAPVVLGFGGMMMDQDWLSRFGIEPLGAYVETVAKGLEVPAATILNEVWELDHAIRGISSGFAAVMVNTCELPFEENAALTRALVERARPAGVEVQAELGRLPNFGEDAIQALTDPDEAAKFVAQTGVDFLAVSIGNQHLRTQGEDAVDLGRLERIRAKVDVPLVIHGGSGYPPDTVRATIDAGVSLFHVGTVMKKRYFEEARRVLGALGGEVNYQAVVGSRKEADFLAASKAAVKDAVRERMRLFKASGNA
jgi:fructose-bisphosphate aldolase class II